MLKDILATTKIGWRRFYNWFNEISPALDAEGMKRLSWARRIESYDAVPDSYQFFFAPLLAQGRAFPYTILTPNFEGLLHSWTNEKLVCELDGEIFVLEKAGNAVKVFEFPIEGISRLEVRIVLLVSQITLCGATKGGLPASIAVKFNTASEELFGPILEKIRQAPLHSEDHEPNPEIRKFDYLEKLNYKFMSYARRSLLEGEKVQQVVLQPRIQARVLTLLGRTFYKVVSPAHLSILTDRELILIHEEDRQKAMNDYGRVWNYIRLEKIVGISLDESAKFPRLSVQLPDDVRIEALYQASAKQEVNQLLSRFASKTLKN